ncbi:YceH family protein [Vibrio sp. IRLE0018]|uniref:YceH family protein n=1 Tax=Vibrio TaxID=662 RepID=UPI0015935E9E|nr:MULTISPECIES: YceH family protein [Vibrio]MCF8777559.1 YceH family protein [Vibrio floridensis]NVC61544.1 DUF480 domain-containing protein [Vibrio sp. 05-20-BW147]HAS6346699.1 DUF480 domain-containing protein [Vibrio vulnificus]
MRTELTPIEARVIGCLIEKEVTTPDQYPLSLNALTNACNQKSNREPVMSLSESEVLDAVDQLISRRLVSDESGFNSRVSKYQHRFCNTEFGDLKLSAQEKGIVCCMLLRGPQTPGELRTRTNRLATFADVKEVETVLDKLASEERGQLVVKLSIEPGKRESRYMHQFCGDVDVASYQSSSPVNMATASLNDERIVHLEEEVETLKQELSDLKALVQSLL